MRQYLNHPIVDAAFRIATIFSIFMATWAVVDTRTRAECQAQYNQILTERSQALIEDSANRELAESDSWRDLASLVHDIAEQDQAGFPESVRSLNESLAARAEAVSRLQAARETHPLPPPPSVIC